MRTSAHVQEAASGTQVGSIMAVLAGRAVPYTRPGTRSAIDKHPVKGRVPLGPLGLEGDEQGDPAVHGGPNKAVLVYASEHYAGWRETLGPLRVLEQPGAFGENLHTAGMTETAVCLGDRMRIGSALVEIAQPRQPCWKLSDRFGVSDMDKRVLVTGRSGWYLRVLEPGAVQAGDAVTLDARPYPEWPLRRLIALLPPNPFDPAEGEAALALPLVPGWRRPIEARLRGPSQG